MLSEYSPTEGLMRPLTIAVGVALLSPCTLVAQTQPDKHPSSIVISTALPKDKALEQAASGLVSAGYVVENANAISITTAPRTFKNVWDLTIRVNVVTAGDSSNVVVSGTYSVPTMHLHDQTVEGGHGGVKGRMWQELTTAADGIRGRVAAP
jgi:hypothetical protein